MQLKKEFNYIELLVISILCFSLLGYLTIRGITNIGAILLASIGLYLFAKKYSLLKKEIGNKNLLIIFLAYCSVFIANLLSQFFKKVWLNLFIINRYYLSYYFNILSNIFPIKKTSSDVFFSVFFSVFLF